MAKSLSKFVFSVAVSEEFPKFPHFTEQYTQHSEASRKTPQYCSTIHWIPVSKGSFIYYIIQVGGRGRYTKV